MVVTLHVAGFILRRSSPIRVCYARAEQVVFKCRISIACPSVKPIDVVLVAHQIEIHTGTRIRGFRSIMDAGGLFGMVGLAYSEFKYGEILVFQVYSQGSFILSVVAHLSLYQA